MKILFCLLIAVISMASQAEPIFDKEEDEYIPRKSQNHLPQKPGADGLPEYPDDNNLRQLNIRDSRSIFYVDISSITSSIKDNIPRMVIVAISPSGARTVTYEGFDCGKRRYMAYGYAGPEGPLRPFKDPVWKRIIDQDIGRYRRTLVDSYLCTSFGYAASRDKILSRMKNLKPYTQPNR